MEENNDLLEFDAVVQNQFNGPMPGGRESSWANSHGKARATRPAKVLNVADAITKSKKSTFPELFGHIPALHCSNQSMII